MKIIFRLLHRVTKALVIIMLCLSLLACILFPPFGAFLKTLLGYAIAAMAPAACVVLLVTLTVALIGILKRRSLAAIPMGTRDQIEPATLNSFVEADFCQNGEFNSNYPNHSVLISTFQLEDIMRFRGANEEAGLENNSIDVSYVNPATGLIMLDDAFDINGNAYSLKRDHDN